jgi:hypothetical protein
MRHDGNLNGSRFVRARDIADDEHMVHPRSTSRECVTNEMHVS